MFKHIAAIEKVTSQIKVFKAGKEDPDCYVAGLNSYENARLSQIKMNCLTADRLIGHSFFVIGECLIEANQILKTKAAFEAWVNKNCNFKVRTAYNTINAVLVVREYPSLASLDKSLLYYMGSRVFSRKLKKIIADHQVGDFNLTKVDLLALEADYLEGKITEDSETVIKHLKKQNNIDLNEKWLVETNKLIKKLKNDLEKINELKVAQERVVGKNQTVRKCSKSLGDILSVAIKGCEEFAQKIDGKPPVVSQDIQVSATPTDAPPEKPGLFDLPTELSKQGNALTVMSPDELNDSDQIIEVDAEQPEDEINTLSDLSDPRQKAKKSTGKSPVINRDDITSNESATQEVIENKSRQDSGE